MTFWHYTCDHGRDALGEAGELRSVIMQDMDPLRVESRHRWLLDLIWLTDLDWPDRDALGLTSYTITCDRTRHRYRITDTSNVIPWAKHARTLTRSQREALEGVPGARPAHWWVSTRPVPATLDEIRVVAP